MQFLGVLSITVIEGSGLLAKDRSGTSDPFVKIYYKHIQNAKNKWKTPWIVENCNPIWKEGNSFTEWIRETPVEIKVEVWDHNQIMADEFIGAIDNIVHPDCVDSKTDNWFELKDRKGSPCGKLHLVVELRFTGNIKPTYWQEYREHSFISLDILPNEPTPLVELQGDFDDLFIAKLCNGLNIGLPRKESQLGKPYFWKIPLATSGDYKAAERTYRLMVSLADRLSMYGYRILKGGRLFTQHVGTTSHHQHIHVVKQMSILYMTKCAAPRDPNSPDKISNVHFRTKFDEYSMRWIVQLFGEVHPMLVKSFPSHFRPQELLDQDGTFICWELNVNMDIKTVFKCNWGDFSFKSHAWEQFGFQVMNTMRNFGFHYVTSVGERHWLTHDGDKPGESNGAPFLIMNPYVYNVEIQGQITPEESLNIGKALGKDPTVLIDNPSLNFYGYKYSLTEMFNPPITAEVGILATSRMGNQSQRNILKVVDILSTSGWELLTEVNLLDLLFQKSNSPSQTLPNLMVEMSPESFNGVEVQGNIDDQIITDLMSCTGLAQPEKTTLKDSKDSYWRFKVEVPNYGLSNSEHKREVRIQQDFAKVLNGLSTLGWSVKTTYGREGPLLLQGVSGGPSFRYLFVSPAKLEGKVAMEFVGNFPEGMLELVASQMGLSPPEKWVDDKDNALICWRIVIPWVFEGMNVLRSELRKIEDSKLKCMEALAKLGWNYLLHWKDSEIFWTKS